MKTYAWQEGARRYLKEVTGVQPIGICVHDERGIMEFKAPSRYMQMAMWAIRKNLNLTDEQYTFERSAHHMMDKFSLGQGREIQLQYNFGAQHMVIRLIDDAEPADDLGENK